MKNTVQVAKVTGFTMVESDAGYANFEVEVRTEGGISMALSIPHYWAAILRNSLIGGIEDMDADYRRLSWWESAPGTDARKAQVIGPKPGTAVEEKAA